MPVPTSGYLAEDGRFFTHQDDCAYYEYGVRLREQFMKEVDNDNYLKALPLEQKNFLFAKTSEFIEANAELIQSLSTCFLGVSRRLQQDRDNEVARQSTDGVPSDSERVRSEHPLEVGPTTTTEDTTLNSTKRTRPFSPRSQREEIEGMNKRATEAVVSDEQVETTNG